MDSHLTEYVLDLEGLSPRERSDACAAALTLVAAEMAFAETDIPWWGNHEAWPPQVLEAAERLRDRFVPAAHGRTDEYHQTGVQDIADLSVRRDFLTFAPYAYDATFWRIDREIVASLADEADSFILLLNDQQRAVLTDLVGFERLVNLRDWRRAHPSFWRRLLTRLGG